MDFRQLSNQLRGYLSEPSLSLLKEFISDVPDAFWDGENGFFYLLSNDFKHAHIEALELVLPKLRGNLYVHWKMVRVPGIFDKQVVTSFFRALAANTSITHMMFDTCYYSREGTKFLPIMEKSTLGSAFSEGLMTLIRENANITSLSLATGKITDETPAALEAKKKAGRFMLQCVLSNLFRYNNIVDLAFHGFDLDMSCNDFLDLLARAPPRLWFNHGSLSLNEDVTIVQKESRLVLLGLQNLVLSSATCAAMPGVMSCFPLLSVFHLKAHMDQSIREVASLLNQPTISAVYLSIHWEDDYKLGDLFHVLHDNKTIEALTIRFTMSAKAKMDCFYYHQYGYFEQLLEESNTTLKAIGLALPPYLDTSGERVSQGLCLGMNYLLALNRFGRGRIRQKGQCTNIGELLGVMQEKLAQEGRPKRPNGFLDFVPLAYGLLRESPGLWAKTRDATSAMGCYHCLGSPIVKKLRRH